MKLFTDIAQTAYEHQDNALTALITLVVSAIIRYFEKKHDRKNEEKRRSGQA
jgi:hypothetical protein